MEDSIQGLDQNQHPMTGAGWGSVGGQEAGPTGDTKPSQLGVCDLTMDHWVSSKHF